MGGFSTIGGGYKNPIKTLVLSACGISFGYSVSASRTIYLNKPIRVTRFSGSGFAIWWGFFYSYGSAPVSVTPTLIVDGVSNPTLPVVANQYIQIVGSASTPYTYGIVIVITAEVDYEEVS
ncbi:MAG: hypothetical protein QW096_11985 [Thermofilaceae archaeon]